MLNQGLHFEETVAMAIAASQTSLHNPLKRQDPQYIQPIQ